MAILGTVVGKSVKPCTVAVAILDARSQRMVGYAVPDRH
jgi:hypothetical protein